MVSAALHEMPHAGSSHVRDRESFVSAVTSRRGRRCLILIALVSGLFTRDLVKKPSYRALDDLINNEWKTRTTAKAEGGRVSFRGFRGGAYRLSWKGDGEKTFSKTVYLK